MSEFVHIPVLAEATQQYLAPKSGGIYCDGTLGGGGHARQTLLASAPNGRLIGIDRDEVALAAAGAGLAEFGERVTLVHNTFGNIAEVFSELGIEAVDGMLIDIGPSSPQFDTADRGFSFGKAGPLDMRMDQSTGETAGELIKRLDPNELANIIFKFGEERYSRRIAGRVKEAQIEGQLQSTLDLADIVAGAIPAAVQRRMKIHPATRTFQALRIAVNGELDQLGQFLSAFPDLLAPGGRCAVISFHSLEDRMVKRTFRELAWSSSYPPDLAVKAGERVDPICKVLTRKPVFATEEEKAANPRARSARLRACEKLAN